MPRPRNPDRPDLKTYSLYLTPHEADAADLLARVLLDAGIQEIANDKGEPGRSALFNYLVREEIARRAKRLERAAKADARKSEKNRGVGH